MDVQRALKRRGYYAGAIDGDIGPGSRSAIRAFQADRGLRVTGRIDSTLLRSLGIAFSASGATEPGLSLARGEESSPWTLCRRPWSLMYVTANGRALPCCIAPFSQRGYEHYTLGDATQEALREIWNGERYQAFRRALHSDRPPETCANCGLRWSL